MAPNQRPSIPHYLMVQCWLGLAIGSLFALIAFATDLGGIGSLLAEAPRASTIIFVVGSVLTFLPLVLATGIGLLPFHDR